MPNLEDHNMDKMFQVGADRHDFSYNPEAWEQMTHLLDEDKKRRRRALWLWFGLGMLLLIGGLYYLMIKPTIAEADQVENPANEQLTEVTPSNEVNAQEVKPASDDLVLGAATGSPGTAVDPAKPTTKELNPVHNTTTVPTSVVAPPTMDGNNVTPAKSTNTESAPVLEQEPVVEEGETAPTPVESVRKPVARITSLLPLMETEKLAVETLIKERSINPVSLTEEKEADRPSSGFAVGVGGGVVFGAVADDGFAMAQPRYGGKIEYRLRDKWAFGTGAYLNDVCYQTTTENYTAKAGFWTDGILPEAITGECRILEVPLLATYYFRGSRASGPYLSGGLTTYFMLREDYSFKYEFEYPDVIKSWREENAYQHFLGLGQFSFGYQRASKKKSAFQVESFVQLPLTGIGHGDVRLMTIGASINYTLDFRK